MYAWPLHSIGFLRLSMHTTGSFLEVFHEAYLKYSSVCIVFNDFGICMCMINDLWLDSRSGFAR
jgi:hypothetical protein